MRNRAKILGAAVLAGVLVMGACSSIFRQPEVRLDGLRMSGIGLRGATLVARLHISNPNDFGLATRAFTYDLELQDADSAGEWIRLAQGNVEQEIEVGGKAAKTVEIPIEFRYSDLGPAVKSLIDRGTFAYRVSGRIEVQEPLSRSVPYRKTGQVSLEGVK